MAGDAPYSSEMDSHEELYTHFLTGSAFKYTHWHVRWS